MDLICALTEWKAHFCFVCWLYYELYLVGVGAVDDPLLSRGEHCSPAVIYERYFIYISSATPHNPNRRKKQSGDCSPLCFWKEKLLFSASKNDSLILGIRVKFLECYADLNLRAVLLINRCRGYAAA